MGTRWCSLELSINAFYRIKSIILIIAKIIQDCVWSIQPIKKVEILKKACLKVCNTIQVTNKAQFLGIYTHFSAIKHISIESEYPNLA